MDSSRNKHPLEEVFTYDNMCSEKSIKTPTHTKTQDEVWSYLNRISNAIQEPTEKPSSRSGRMAAMQNRLTQTTSLTGLKFQISLDDTDKENLQKAWDLAILPNLLKHNVNMTKICNKPLSALSEDQDGKQVTIYAYRNTEKHEKEWEDLINDITADLVKHNIKTGPVPQGRNKEGSFFQLTRVNGSNFFTWQYDTGQTGLYTIHKMENNAPEEIKVMCGKINVKVDNQPKPKDRVATVVNSPKTTGI